MSSPDLRRIGIGKRSWPTRRRLLIACGTFPLILLATATLAGGASPLPPVSGDWVVDTDISVADTTLQVNGSLLVTNNSALDLRNVSLFFMVPGGGASLIDVLYGSSFSIEAGFVDRANASTTIGGNIAGTLSVVNSTLRNLTVIYPDGTGGIRLNGGRALLKGVNFTDCVVGFTTSTGNLTVEDSYVDACSDTFFRGDPLLSGSLTITVRRSQVLRTPSLGVVQCGNCSGDIEVVFENISFSQSPSAGGSLLQVNGTLNLGSFVGRFSNVRVAAPNFRLLTLQPSLPNPSSADNITLYFDNSSTTGAGSAIGYLIFPYVRSSLSVRIEDSSAQGLVGFYLIPSNSLVPSWNASLDFEVRRSALGALYLLPAGLKSMNGSFEGSSLNMVVIRGNFTDDARFRFANCAFSRPSFPWTAINVNVPVGSVIPRLFIDSSVFQDAKYGVSTFVFAGIEGFHTSPVNASITNTIFSNITYGVYVGNPEGATPEDVGDSSIILQNVSAVAVQRLVVLTGPVLGTRGNGGGARVFIEDIQGTNVDRLLWVDSDLPLSKGPPVNVALVNITLSGSAEILNYTGPGTDLLRISNITTSANGTTPGIWIRYAQRLNLSLSDAVLSNHTTGIRVERAIASFDRDDWNLSALTVSEAIVGVELRTVHVIDARFSLTTCNVSASQSIVFLLGVAGNVTNCTLSGSGNAVDAHDSQVVVLETRHNTLSVLTDFRLGEGFLEHHANYSLAFRWARTAVAPVGWLLNLHTATGDPFLNETLDAQGRPFAGVRYGLIYKFVQNLSNFDARFLEGNLSIPGRAPTPVNAALTWDLTGIVVDVPDTVDPGLMLPQFQSGGIFVNASPLALEVSLFDPETGLLYVYVEASGVYNTTVYATGGPRWWNLSIPLSLPLPATYILIVRAGDLNGNEIRVQAYLTLDTTSPTPSLLNPAPGSALNETNLTMTFASDPDTVFLSVNGVAATKLANFVDDRPWALALTLPEGLHNLTVVAIDRAGNRALTNVALEVDLTPPTPTILGISNGLEMNATPLRVTVMTDVGDKVLLDGIEQGGVAGAFDFSVSLPLGESTHFITVRDRAGNAVSFAYTVTLDVWAPTIQLNAPWAPGGVYYVNRTLVSLSLFVSSDTAKVETAGALAFPDANGSVQLSLALAEGEHLVTIDAVDRAGNHATVSLSVVVDLTPPSLLYADPASGSLQSRRKLPVHFEVNEPVDIRLGAINASAPTASANISLTLVEGPNAFILLLVDRAGNSNQTPYNLIGDFTPPLLQILAPANQSAAASSTIRIEGRAEPGSRVYIGGAPLDVRNDGSFSIDAPLEMGTNRFVFVARDPAGNDATFVLEVTREGPSSGDLLVAVGVATLATVAAAILILRVRQRSRVPPATPQQPQVRSPPRPPQPPK